MAKTRKNLLGLLQLAAQRIGERIVFLRGERVLLDADLATLYGVTTGALNRAVKRNRERFPADFMLQLTADEADSLRCQAGILKTGRCQNCRRHAVVGSPAVQPSGRVRFWCEVPAPAALAALPAGRCALPSRDDQLTPRRHVHRRLTP